jgi:hypothetical protein
MYTHPLPISPGLVQGPGLMGNRMRTQAREEVMGSQCHLY